MLEFKNISKIFNNKKVLDNISFTVKNGEIALFLGPSGVGKSTLLRILNNLETPSSGNIFLDNKQLDITQINKNHTTGMIFQQFNLFNNMTVERNITFVLEKSAKFCSKKSKKIAKELLEKYGLLEKANVSVKKLSGGQKQRLAIARSLSLKPRIICFDEPTSALDPFLVSFIAQTITELAKENYIILVATHDVRLTKLLPCTIYLMHDGKIIEVANSKDFEKDKNQYPLIKNFIGGN